MKFTWQATVAAPSVKQFLFKKGLSHNLWARQKQLDAHLLLNGQVVEPSRTVTVGDTVSYILRDEVSDNRVAASNLPIELQVVDDNWLVINKLAGITSVPGPSNQTTTVVNRVKGWLIAKHAKNLVPHLITRLDRDTSGLILVARNSIVQGMIAPQVDHHLMTKEYLALVQGVFSSDHGEISKPIGRVDGKIARAVMSNGQQAITEFWVVEQFKEAALIKLRLKTGRTHQIRVHMQDAHHPLLGDELYGGPMNLIQRQALHAARLVFTDPITNKELTFSAPLPDDMQTVLDGLRQDNGVE